MVKNILFDSKNFKRNDFVYQFSEGILDYFLIGLPTSDLWKAHRKLVVPAFAPEHLRRTASLTLEYANRQVSEWSALMGDKDGKLVIDCRSFTTSLVLDLIGQIGFGVDFKEMRQDEHKAEIVKLWEKVDDITLVPLIKRVIVPKILWPLVGIDAESTNLKKPHQKLKSWIKTLIDDAKAMDVQDDEKWKLNILQRLVRGSKTGHLLSEDEIYGEIVGFLLAGQETTANTLNFLFLELCQNQDMQQKLYEEIKDFTIIPQDVIGSLESLKYLDNFLKETQRLHTVVPGVWREAQCDMEMNGYMLPKNATLILNFWSVHRDPNNFTDPLTFNPDRWNSLDKSSALFFPFGAGLHACVGKKMSVIEMKLLLIRLLQKYHFSMDSSSDLSFVTTTSHGVNGLKLNVSLRSLYNE